MAFNPFPASYNNGFQNNGYQQPYYQQPMYQPQPMMQQSYQPPMQQIPQMPTQDNGIKWVQGEAGARAYYVEPGTSVWLMDSEDMVGYVKTVNMNGIPQPLEVYDLIRRATVQPVSYAAPPMIEQKAETDMSGYVKKEDVEAMISAEVERRIAEMTSVAQTAKVRKEKADA